MSTLYLNDRCLSGFGRGAVPQSQGTGSSPVVSGTRQYRRQGTARQEADVYDVCVVAGTGARQAPGATSGVSDVPNCDRTVHMHYRLP